MIRGIVISFFLFSFLAVSAVNGWVSGVVIDQHSTDVLQDVEVLLRGENTYSAFTNKKGEFHINEVIPGDYQIHTYAQGYQSKALLVRIEPGVQLTVRIQLEEMSVTLSEAEIFDSRETDNLKFLTPVQEAVVYSGMKNEVINPGNLTANESTQNSRQIYARVAGVNIWESDGAGIQLGIGTRGLSPDRSSNFNVRQNGYDISADALGYPESYYTPPLEAVEKIELVRGASSLQYGTQFGGLLNFKMKEGSSTKKLETTIRQTFGTYGLGDTLVPSIASSNTFVSLGGSSEALQYYGFYSHKVGSGWRPNSHYSAGTAYGNIQWRVSELLTLSAEVTVMDYLAQQPGGLTDAQFETDPRQSFRERNWFAVDWQLASLNMEYKLGALTELTSKFFALHASRKALGHRGPAGRIDFLGPRDLIIGTFANLGNETRLIHRLNMGERIAVLSGGVRVYSGHSTAQQGWGQEGNNPNFSFPDGDQYLLSDFEFPNFNVALFSQEIIPITDKLSIVPGVRWEFIKTQSNGQFRESVLNGAGTVLEDTLVSDSQHRQRSFVLGGIGMSKKFSESLELYGNFSQNYRAINFTDIQLRNVGLLIDPNIHDERGFNADLGLRGVLAGKLNFDISCFVLRYNDRIGTYYTSVPDPVLGAKPIRYRTNISDARNLGIECLLETDVVKWFAQSSSSKVNVFVNGSWINARYLGSEESAFTDNEVELVPGFSTKLGVSWSFKSWSSGLQYSWTADQYSDATNALQTPYAVDGLIPSYGVLDFVVNVKLKRWSASCSVNNLSDEKYFTRRASGYPGPGIIPSEGRSIQLSVQTVF